MKNKYDYPRPQLYRESFQSLDGEWLLNQQIIQVIESKLATDKELAGEFRKWNSRI